MKVIILAAGQGSRLRPLTDEKPKCMVEINGKSIIKRQLDTLMSVGVEENDIYILTGYKSEVLKEYLKDTKINFIENSQYESTNMVCTLMCAKNVLKLNDDIIVSYGDIVYEKNVISKLIESKNEISVIVDSGWYEYWQKRSENPIDDAESLIICNDSIVEIGQKIEDISKIDYQYIGLMKYSGQGINRLIDTCEKAKIISANGQKLWRTSRNYSNMYMTDLLQGLIDENYEIKPVIINRGWYEIDNYRDLKVAENEI
ncbi:sugar phosphate nucleotidyltransferase [Clostridium saccharoperbutylacetonicum]|uniref:phosphocholine cytidylyltransferase family protein n=1 Tax=Clostridium saccharoperbutylacetonicum TaxID=36745 RepID=UPI000983B6D9|nr:phosphocholine cytidylyltransferase family protein [Clostridium saccharoperbutylacetonicum]AQR97007.1 bifunctional protein GlmU [Clostridium saccharoperbutylacetonicum]NSB32886.1 choline kinase [Clostridium saccharoperbutylacetonicum]